MYLADVFLRSSVVCHMNEKLLQFIWQYQIYNAIGLSTIQGEKIAIINPGKLNHHQGPDFTMARIRLHDQEWVGNIELHVHTSDWALHKHDDDPNFNNVILHVVWQNDVSDHRLPVLELESRVPSILISKFRSWSLNTSFISCSGNLGSLERKVVYPFLNWLSSNRMNQKTIEVLKLVDALSGDWEEAFWRQLAKCFGHKVNAASFERMAENLPYKVLLKHNHNLKQLEALIFGQAGLLHSGYKDAYADALHREFIFLRKKYALRKNVFPLYYLRMRPINFPTIRLAQLASLIYNEPDLFRKIKDLDDLHGIKNRLNIKTSDYWNQHYRFGEDSVMKLKTVGDGLMDKLMINTIIPFIKAYKRKRGRETDSAYLDQWSVEMRSENNHIVSGFLKLGIKARNMQESQGLIELKTAYCDQLKCLDCTIGRFLLRQPV